MANEKKEGSTSQLVAYSWWYFFFYVLTGVGATYFRDKRPGFPHMPGMEFLFNSTVGGMFVALAVVALSGWAKSFKSKGDVSLGSFTFPREYLWLIPSGLCTAVIIPTTTFMYTLPVSVMVAMTLMRASVIVIGRVVDAIQIHQGILKKRVSWEENLAALFAFATVFVVIGFAPPGGFNFLGSVAALVNMGFYVGSYAVRIYIMNHYKNTVGPPDAKGFFAVEQGFASIFAIVGAAFFIASPELFGWQDKRILQTVAAAGSPSFGAIGAGMFFGAVAFFSVALFMFKGRTATFATVVNRLASLLAGTTATLVFWKIWGGKFPENQDWFSLLLVLIAIGLLVKAEMRRAAEKRVADQLPPSLRSL